MGGLQVLGLTSCILLLLLEHAQRHCLGTCEVIAPPVPPTPPHYAGCAGAAGRTAGGGRAGEGRCRLVHAP